VNSSPQSLGRSTPAHVAFAAMAMGGWALFANRSHGMAGAVGPALAQGVMSGLITLALKRTLEALTGRFKGALAYVVPPAITATTVLAILIGVHALIGTPEIAATIAVPWAVSTLYAFGYTATLVKGSS
jgi:hypothetical protein